MWVITKDGSIWPSWMRLQELVGPAIDVGLPGADRQSLVHHGAQRDLVDQAAIDARNGDGAAGAADIHHLAQDVGRSVSSISACLARSYMESIERVAWASMPDRIDAFFGSLAVGQFVQPLDNAFLVEIDGRSRRRLSPWSAVRARGRSR